MILGLGNDIIDIRRIEKTIERYGDRFLDACLHRHGARANRIGRASRAASYAKRFAAKEACAKALGTGFRQGRVLARHGRGQPALRPADHGADRRRRRAARAHHAAGLRGPRRPDPDRRLSRWPRPSSSSRPCRPEVSRDGSAPECDVGELRRLPLTRYTGQGACHGRSQRVAVWLRVQRQDAARKREHELATPTPTKRGTAVGVRRSRSSSTP